MRGGGNWWPLLHQSHHGRGCRWHISSCYRHYRCRWTLAVFVFRLVLVDALSLFWLSDFPSFLFLSFLFSSLYLFILWLPAALVTWELRYFLSLSLYSFFFYPFLFYSLFLCSPTLTWNWNAMRSFPLMRPHFISLVQSNVG